MYFRAKAFVTVLIRGTSWCTIQIDYYYCFCYCYWSRDVYFGRLCRTSLTNFSSRL